MPSKLAINLEELIPELPQGVRLHEWIPGHPVNLAPSGENATTYFDSCLIGLETIDKRNICTFEVSPKITKEDLAELIRTKSAELLAK